MGEPLKREEDPEIEQAKHRAELSRDAVGGRGEGQKELSRDTPMAGVGQNTGSRAHTRGAAVSERNAEDDERPPTPPDSQLPDRKSQI